jgi:hypothetical protein
MGQLGRSLAGWNLVSAHLSLRMTLDYIRLVKVSATLQYPFRLESRRRLFTGVSLSLRLQDINIPLVIQQDLLLK